MQNTPKFPTARAAWRSVWRRARRGKCEAEGRFAVCGDDARRLTFGSVHFITTDGRVSLSAHQPWRGQFPQVAK